MNGSGSAWWMTEDGEWRQGNPPPGWWQANDGHWYPPQLSPPPTEAMPATGQEPLDVTVPMAAAEPNDPTAGTGAYPGGAPPGYGSSVPPGFGEERKGIVDRYRAWPLWARIGVPVTSLLVILVFIAALTTDPEEDGTNVAATGITTTTERETTTTRPPKTTTTTSRTSTTTTTAPPPTTAPPTTTTTPPPPPPPTATAPPPPPPTESNCHPSYQPCVAIASDADCAGGSGDGPVYVSGSVTVSGPDDYGLDNDGDGIGCDP